MKIFTIIILLILGVLIVGCIETEKEKIEKIEKEKIEKENLDWYMSIYEGPSNIENSENARMSIIPHLRELGWDGGINVIYGAESVTGNKGNHSILITLPFKLSNKSTDYINQTLSNFSFVSIKLNEKIEKTNLENKSK